METKSFEFKKFKSLKEEGEGVFEAIVACYTKDDFGEKIRPGAFKDTLEKWEKSGAPIPIIFSHRWDDILAYVGYALKAKELPEEGFYVKGKLDVEDDEIAKKLWGLLKRRIIKEFSIAYVVVEGGFVKEEDDEFYELRKLDLIELGPTLRGANRDTRLISVKKAVASHSTATSDGPWDGPANEKNVLSGKDAEYYRKIYAWNDPDGDPSVKSSWRFIHHEVSSDGDPGAANVRACQTGIGVLNGARGGTTIPDEDREGVWRHLARHLRDADLEPPELKSAREIGMKVGRRNSEKDEAAIIQIAELAEKILILTGELLSTPGEEEEKKAKTDEEDPKVDEQKFAPYLSLARMKIEKLKN